MPKRNLWNTIIGKQKVDVAPTTSSNQLPYHSLRTFFFEHPIPSKSADSKTKNEFYKTLHEMNDSFLPEDQKKTRYALLVELRKDSGIKFDNGVAYNGYQL